MILDTGGASPAVDIWAFGCLLFELITSPHSLFELLHVGLQRDVLDDEHLIQLNQVIGPLPKAMRAKWPRYSKYFSPDGKRSDVEPLDFDKARMARLEAMSEDVSSTTSFSFDHQPLEKMLHDYRNGDIGDREEREILGLLRDVLRFDPSERPSAAELLARPWFSG